MANIPCSNPEHGVKNHIAGTAAANECQRGSESKGAVREGIPAGIPSSVNRAGTHALDDAIRAYRHVEMARSADEFIETELGGQFNEESLAIAYDAMSFSLEVEESFENKGKKYGFGQVVNITRNGTFLN